MSAGLNIPMNDGGNVNRPLQYGPILTDQDGELDKPILMCMYGKYRCSHFGINDVHYFYCSAQDADNKHAKPGEYAYPWPGAGARLFQQVPNKDCPYV